ncbi:MAG: alpha-L-fucosidase [Gemmatimonadetes bacterium]|nr:alpha-L-fucosidase [Gemmatimonadota bacterium]
MKRRGFVAALGAGVLTRRVPLPNAAGRPVPTPAQLRWQREELSAFVHFGVNTYTDREWGDGTEDPRLFRPDGFDADVLVRQAVSAGVRSLVITAKHHDGFCLWPTALTRHSVASSPWRDGQGDVVGDLARACRAQGIGFGVYLSPWDRHDPSYGDSPRYMDLYIAQLEELLTRYGRLVEVWFDGANGEGPNGRRQVYDWGRIHGTVRRLQPDAVMFSDAGPDVRWIGNERGVAGETCWSTIDPAVVPFAGFDAPWVGDVLQQGHRDGAAWRPGETDVSIRPGWFYHASQDAQVRSVDNLLQLYFTSVGRNSKLLLNVPPTRDGTWHANDLRALDGFAVRRRAIFTRDLAIGASVKSASALPGRGAARVVDGSPDSWWEASGTGDTATLELTLPRPETATVVRLAEPIATGQLIERFEVEALDAAGDAWWQVASGTTIGYARLARFDARRVQRLRVRLWSSLGAARLSQVSLYHDPPT